MKFLFNNQRQESLQLQQLLLLPTNLINEILTGAFSSIECHLIKISESCFNVDIYLLLSLLSFFPVTSLRRLTIGLIIVTI